MKTENNKTKRLAKGIKVVAKKMAAVSCGSASVWGAYQPKEPKMFK